ncbi:MAG: DNA-directed RNA polymerase subunit K [Candidatus Altiarchaeia archaeon]
MTLSYTKFEVARLVGARALQIKMGAPILVKVPKTMEKPLDIARLELAQGILPITVKIKEDKRVRKESKILPDITIDEEEVEEEPKETKEAPEEESFEEEAIVEETD